MYVFPLAENRAWNSSGARSALRIRISRQRFVYRTAKLIGRKPLTRDMNVRNLALRMHAGVGSTGANNTNIRIYEHPDHPLQLTLNGPVILLHLPTMEVGAVVLD